LNKISNIVFIGAGNLATNLAIALFNKNFNIIQIYSRTIISAKNLALKVKADYTDNLNELNHNADLYILSVSDGILEEIIEKIPIKDKIFVHTSGSLKMDVLKSLTDSYGVFYPLQTFSKKEITDFKNIPLCIESSHTIIENQLIEIAKLISNNVNLINSEQRKILHISAVFACNFSSYMYFAAEEILKENQLNFDLLKPLIQRTAEKIQTQSPEEAITGPARRNDMKIIQNHLEFLIQHPEFYEIYKNISKNIVKHFHRNKK